MYQSVHSGKFGVGWALLFARINLVGLGVCESVLGVANVPSWNYQAARAVLVWAWCVNPCWAWLMDIKKPVHILQRGTG